MNAVLSPQVFDSVSAFALDLAYVDMPSEVVVQAQRCLLDLIGVAAAGSRTTAASIANHYASTQLCGRDAQARMLFDGRSASLAGAAFAGAATLDAFDAHDGHVLTKGHAGAALLPALLACVDGIDAAPLRYDGREFLTALVVGYEIATRAGIALHASVAEFHCSGAWNSLGCAALASRYLALDRKRVSHALGIAEYLGPRGQILRVCDHPTMLKDGSAWGAHVGMTAAILARDGFTGAPAITIENTHDIFGDLGERWRINEQYFKAYPVCRWAQPAIEAALALRRRYEFDNDDIVNVTIESFREAIDLGSQCRYPATTDEAQYSLTWPVACALVHGDVTVVDEALQETRGRALIDRITLRDNVEFSRRFPAERWARVSITLADSRTLVSDPARARGNPENPLDDEELVAKYHDLADPVVGTLRAQTIIDRVEALPRESSVLRGLIDDLLAPISARDA
ncbi:MAG TPA: MmgE/PrpD family protein [Casimicrobiaceae bacterium]|nr:MmgE/PrpD family protein [Casimicrobiaceae bacterium]